MAQAKQKTYVIRSTRNRDGSSFDMEGTVAELTEKCSYTLDCGYGWQHEKGNKKINCKPTTIKGLITNLNNALNNAASNGYADKQFTLVG